MITTLRISIAVENNRKLETVLVNRFGKTDFASEHGMQSAGTSYLRALLITAGCLGRGSGRGFGGRPYAKTSQFLGYHFARAESVTIALHNRRRGVKDWFVCRLIRR